MHAKHKKTLEAIFANPVNGNIEWKKIESLLMAVGCEFIEGTGSRIAFRKHGVKLHIHRPHPGKEALVYRVQDVRKFLTELGIKG